MHTYHWRSNIKPIDAKSSTHFHFEVESNDEDPKFVVRDHVRISKYGTIIRKGYNPDWTEQFLLSRS